MFQFISLRIRTFYYVTAIQVSKSGNLILRRQYYLYLRANSEKCLTQLFSSSFLPLFCLFVCLFFRHWALNSGTQHTGWAPHLWAISWAPCVAFFLSFAVGCQMSQALLIQKAASFCLLSSYVFKDSQPLIFTLNICWYQSVNLFVTSKHLCT